MNSGDARGKDAPKLAAAEHMLPVASCIAMPPWRLKAAIRRVVSAKADATRARRMPIRIDASAEGRKLGSPTKQASDDDSRRRA